MTTTMTRARARVRVEKSRSRQQRCQPQRKKQSDLSPVSFLQVLEKKKSTFTFVRLKNYCTNEEKKMKKKLLFLLLLLLLFPYFAPTPPRQRLDLPHQADARRRARGPAWPRERHVGGDELPTVPRPPAAEGAEQ